MKKFFEVTLPDEPFKTTTNLNNKVTCLYEGPKYLVVRVDDATHKLVNVAGSSDNLNDLDLAKFVEEGYSFHILDASVNPFEAAYLTGTYTHDDIPDYEETLPSGEKWTYSFDAGTGVISHVYKNLDMTYNNGAYSTPERLTHGTTKEDFLTGANNLLELLEKSLNENDFLPDEKKKLEDYRTFLKSLSTNYTNIDHWKIRWPIDIPNF